MSPDCPDPTKQLAVEAWIVVLGILLVWGILAGFCSGCMVVYVDGRGAHNAGVQQHEQAMTGSSNTLNNTATVPITQKVMDKVADKVIGAQAVGDVNTSANVKLK